MEFFLRPEENEPVGECTVKCLLYTMLIRRLESHCGQATVG